MPTKKCDAAQRGWNTLRLALLWARKGGAFKRRILTDLNLIPKYLKSLKLQANHDNNRRSMIHYYGEREFSFDETPIIHVKMHRLSSLKFKMPSIPCLNPEVVDFDHGFDGDDVGDYEGRKSFLLKDGEEDYRYDICEEIIPCEEEGIDAKAEEFIAKFYHQMKLQRQISYLHNNDMLTN